MAKKANSRLIGWFNPFIQDRTFAEAKRLSDVTGIDHTQQWEAMKEVKRLGHFPRHTGARL